MLTDAKSNNIRFYLFIFTNNFLKNFLFYDIIVLTRQFFLLIFNTRYNSIGFFLLVYI